MARPARISVIVPVYRAEAHLPTCLDSILSQTHRELEVLLVDDGSPDGSGAICDAYAKRDDRIVVIHKENGGVSSARNAGLLAATGEWVGFVDADDWIEADMFAYLLRLVEKYNGDMAQCGILYEEGDRVTCRHISHEERLLPAHTKDYTLADWRPLANSTCNKLYRRDMLSGLFYNENYPIGEDMLFHLEAAKRTGKLCVGTEAKYHYIQHGESACHRPPTEVTLMSFRNMVFYAMELYREEETAMAYLSEHLLRNEMDICSKLVRFYRPEYERHKAEIRRNVRRRTAQVLTLSGFSVKERLKLLLIGWCWTAYRKFLLLSKQG